MYKLSLKDYTISLYQVSLHNKQIQWHVMGNVQKDKL
jgi:uncharacterized pyridoxal phosphate-containing UPF0001 family protein